MFKGLWNKITGKASEAVSKPGEAGKESVLGQFEKFKGDRKQLFKMMRNPQVRRQVALLYQRMQADGVDVKNEAQVQKWVTEHKDELEKPSAPQTPKVDQVVRSGPDIGRNDPCPCASGKKYKKCCALNS